MNRPSRLFPRPRPTRRSPYRSIVVALDGSAAAEHALPPAIALARASGAAIHLVHVEARVLPFHAAPLRVADTSPRHPHTDAYLAGLRDRIAQREKVPVLAAMIGGPVLGGLLGYAARVGAGLIVMTTHGRAGPHATRLGTIAGLMAAQSSIPVLFI
ncbi:MAG: universal stress protein, partial [Gemmatimonadaceae bacterium]|nr:universal stress protein [Gemmatimonadaceae bacterium]